MEGGRPGGCEGVKEKKVRGFELFDRCACSRRSIFGLNLTNIPGET